MYTICRLKSWDVINLALHMVHDLQLKRRSYGHLKTTVQTMSGNVTAAPPFRNCWTHFGALYGAKNFHTISHFEAWKVRSPMLQMVCKLELKRRSYGRFKTNVQSISGNFAAAPPFRRVFRSYETTLWHTSAASQHRTPISQLKNGLRKSPFSAKSAPRCENPPSFQMAAKWFSSFKMGCKIVSIYSMGCENVSIFSMGCKNVFFFFPLAAKWSPSYEMTSRL